MSKKLIFCLLFMVGLSSMFVISSFSQATIPEEKITIITYYPAPFGVYNRLVTRTFGVGDTNANGDIDINDAPDPTSPDKDGQALIATGLGIGTTNNDNYLLNAAYTNPGSDRTFLIVSGNSGASIAKNDIITFGHTDSSGGTNMEIFGSYGIDGLGQPQKNSIYYDANTHIFRASDGSPYRGTKTDICITENGSVGIGTTDPGSGHDGVKLEVVGYSGSPGKQVGIYIRNPEDKGETGLAIWHNDIPVGGLYTATGLPGITLKTFLTSDTPIRLVTGNPEKVRIFIHEDGNVRIGSTETLPEGKLEVDGEINYVPTEVSTLTGNEGDLYYDKTSKKFRYHDGNSWKDLGGGLGLSGTNCAYYGNGGLLTDTNGDGHINGCDHSTDDCCCPNGLYQAGMDLCDFGGLWRNGCWCCEP